MTASRFFHMEEKILKEALDEIRAYSLLGAKSVLTLDEVALFTGLSKSYLYKLTSSKEIPHYRPSGKFLYFDKLEVENWMKRGRVASNQEVELLAVNHIVTRNGGAQ